MDDDEMTLAAEAEQRAAVEAHDAQLVAEMAREMDPAAWDPNFGMREGQRIGAQVQWAARRTMAGVAARNALPWVKRQCLAAYQEAIDAQDGAL